MIDLVTVLYYNITRTACAILRFTVWFLIRISRGRRKVNRQAMRQADLKPTAATRHRVRYSLPFNNKLGGLISQLAQMSLATLMSTSREKPILTPA
jgi:hypothetical protein